MADSQDRAAKMLNTALEMETKGYEFYQKSLDNCTNSLGKDIFTTLRDDEIVHVDRIKSIYTSLQGANEWNEEWKSMNTGHDNLTDMFRDIAKKNGPDVQASAKDLEALNVGIEFEAAAVEFYTKHLEQATDDIEKDFIEMMILEEKDHHKALTEMHQYLSNPESWFEEMEKITLDGA